MNQQEKEKIIERANSETLFNISNMSMIEILTQKVLLINDRKVKIILNTLWIDKKK